MITPSGPVSYLVGYFDRDYGKSALYAQKIVAIDASNLSSGITLSWGGGVENPARVLAVYGHLTMTNVTITGGWSVAEELPPPDPAMDIVPYSYEVEVEDQYGTPRPVNNLSDIGAYEYYSPPCFGDISGDSKDGDVDGADLAALVSNLTVVDLSTFAGEFGRTDCPIN